VDYWSWQDCTERTARNWLDQYERLVAAYLTFRSNQGVQAKASGAELHPSGQPVIDVETVDLFGTLFHLM
jgi:hypothetical protein